MRKCESDEMDTYPGETRRLEEEFSLVMVDGLAEFVDDLRDEEVRHAPLPRDEGARLGPD